MEGGRNRGTEEQKNRVVRCLRGKPKSEQFRAILRRETDILEKLLELMGYPPVSVTDDFCLAGRNLEEPAGLLPLAVKPAWCRERKRLM